MPAWGWTALVAATLCAPSAPLAACPARSPWPSGDWPVEPAGAGTARDAAAALERYLFPPGAPAKGAVRTDGVLLIRGGRIVYERYGEGWGPGVRHAAWSVTKALTSALAGAAVQRGALSIDDSICLHRPPPRRGCEITVRHLLESASGLDWTETYEGTALQRSSVLAMLYGEGRRDMAGFVLGHARRAPPGKEWAYSSGDSVLLASAIGGALSPSLGRDWPGGALLDRLGMASAILERDGAGTPVGSSWLHATPRDLARLGLLYLDDGCWMGDRILPEGWVERSTSVSPPIRDGGPRASPGDVQGWGWWLNRPVPSGGPAPWPGVPEDAFSARGHWGQLLIVIPSQDLVIVRTGDDREGSGFDAGRFALLAVAAGSAP